MDTAALQFVPLFVGFFGLGGALLGLFCLLTRHNRGFVWHLAGLALIGALVGTAVWTAAAGLPIDFWGPVLTLALVPMILHALQLRAAQQLTVAALALLRRPWMPSGILLTVSSLVAFSCLSPLLSSSATAENLLQTDSTFAASWADDVPGLRTLADLASPVSLSRQAGEEWTKPSGDGRILPLFKGPPAGLPEQGLAHTDQGFPVSLLRYPPQPPASAEMLADEAEWIRERNLAGLLIRTAPPTGVYVCHDWVFTGGQYSMTGGMVETIIADNGYRVVDAPRKGDLAVYRDKHSGTVVHTGIVRLADEEGMTLVESKWAWMGRYLHPASVYYHPDAVCAFYRSERVGHLLKGIEPSEPDEPGTTGLPTSSQSAEPLASRPGLLTP